jgi:hypothetical protein
LVQAELVTLAASEKRAVRMKGAAITRRCIAIDRIVACDIHRSV